MTLAITLTGNGVTLHLQNSSGVATEGGAATAAATTPFICVDEQYTLQAATPSPLWSGGPPLRDGSDNINQSYENVNESIVVAVYGSSPDNLASIIRQLNQMLLAGTPVTLSVQPNGATSAMYTEILSATVQPTTNHEVQPLRGSKTATLQINYVRRPWFGRLSGGETLINAVSLTNTGLAGANTTAFSAGSGDMIYRGGPVNYSASGFSTTTNQIWMASVAARTYDVACASSLSTTSTTPVAATNATAAISASPLTPANQYLLGVRAIVRLNGPPANLRVGVQIETASGASVLWKSSFQGRRGGAVTNTLIDLGGTSLDFFRLNNTTLGTFVVHLYYYSSDGNLAAADLVSTEVLFYYDFCKVALIGNDTMNALTISAFREMSGFAALPITPEGVRGTRVGVDRLSILAGQPPRYFSGASLWAAWFDNADGEHVNTRTATFTATHGPLYMVARGAG